MHAESARSLVDAVLSAFRKGQGHLLEWFPVEDGDREDCYLWSYFATTGMLYQSIRAGDDRRAVYRGLIDGLAHYRSASSDDRVAKYHSERGEARGRGHGPVFFDDNIWVARNLLWAHDVFREPEYLAEAQRVADFVYSAWDEDLGGVSWNEQGMGADGDEQELERGLSANACSILVSAQLYRLTGEDRYLSWARRFHAFCMKTRDAETGIYFNGIHTAIRDGRRIDGDVNKDLYSYNAGSMILADLALFDVTGDPSYVDDAVTAAVAADRAFLRVDESDGTRSYEDFVWFLAILAESYSELVERGLMGPEILDVFAESIEVAATHRSSAGLLPHDYVSGWREGDDAAFDRMLLTHAGTAEIAQLLVAARRL